MTVELSSPDKVLWPALHFTKADLAAYYEAAAPRLLPHLADRPLTFRHQPRGVGDAGFLQKNLPDHAPEFIGRWEDYAHTAKRTVAYALVSDADGLRWCAQQNVTEIHPALFRIDRPERPDTIVLDLDPGPDSVGAPQAALWVKEVLDELALTSMVKTSGGKGVHVLVPLERRYDNGQVRAIALGVAAEVARRHPRDLTVEMRKEDRRGRLFVDWSRGGGGATLIAAWSPRGRPAGTVATPLHWNEVEPDLPLDRFTLRTALDRPDPWAEPPPPQRIERAAAVLDEMRGGAGDG